MNGEKYVPVDCVVLALNYLQTSHMVEIARGKQNHGNYHLHSIMVETQPPNHSEQKVCNPEDIVSRVRQN